MVFLPVFIIFRFGNIRKSHKIYNMLSIIVLASYYWFGVADSSFHSQTLIEILGFISSILLNIREQIGVGIGIPSSLTISKYFQRLFALYIRLSKWSVILSLSAK